jgi:hypothetical protein
MTARPQRITFAEMRESGVRGLLVYCSDYRCAPRAATLAAPLLWLGQRLGFGFGLGIADGLSQHLA